MSGFSRRDRIMRFLLFRVEERWDDIADKRGWPDWASFPDWPRRWLCRLLRAHAPIPDQCCLPEHDYCAWCQRSMPGQADRGAL